MPLSREEFDALQAKGLSPEQIVAMERRVRAANPEMEGIREPNPAPGWMGAIPVAGGMAGGAAGAAGGTVFGVGVGGIPGVIGGAALGTAGGEAVRQHLSRAMGYDAPESATEAAGQIGVAGGVGAVGSAPPLLAIKGLQMAAKSAPALTKMLARLLTRRALGPVGDVMDVAEEIGKMTGGKVAGSIKPGRPVAVSRARPKVASTRPTPQKPVQKTPLPRPSVGPAAAAKAPSRPMRGASGPELERRAAYRARVTGKTQPPETVDLEAQLSRSLEMEKEIAKLGLTSEQRLIARQILRSEGLLK